MSEVEAASRKGCGQIWGARRSTRLCSLRAGHKEKLAALLDLESSKRTSSGPGSPNSRNSGSSRNSGRDEGQEGEENTTHVVPLNLE